MDVVQVYDGFCPPLQLKLQQLPHFPRRAPGQPRAPPSQVLGNVGATPEDDGDATDIVGLGQSTNSSNVTKSSWCATAPVRRSTTGPQRDT